MNYQWYPGHMTKARRAMQEDIGLIDLIIELVDARMPLSSRNPDIDSMGKNKARLLLLNKADLADPKVNAQWADWFEKQGIAVLEINAKSGAGLKSIQGKVEQVCREKLERDRRRGILNRPVRAMVAGIPNVGKSTFINSYAKRACTKTGNKPGVTRGKQWIRLGKGLEFIGSMKDEILVPEEMALDLIAFLAEDYPGTLAGRYGVQEEKGAVMLERICEARNCYLRGQEPGYGKAARLLLDDFRSGRLGRISLERPQEGRTE